MTESPDNRLGEHVASALGQQLKSKRRLGGRDPSLVFLLELTDGSQAVAKCDLNHTGELRVEASMLLYLAEKSSLPVPTVLYCDDGLLLMEFLAGESRFGDLAQRHAAELLADLHSVSAAGYGFDSATLIGGLHQPNPWSQSWTAFFVEQRLLYMGREAMNVGRLPVGMFARLEAFAGHIDRWLAKPDAPSLIHGDAWTGNILASNGRITGFVDPAVYYADAEIELAFTTLFGTFDDRFFDRYREIRPIRPGFMSERRHLYNLYPLLVHVRLFGGSYVQSVGQTLSHFGY